MEIFKMNDANGQIKTYITDGETLKVLRSVYPSAEASGDYSAVHAIISLGFKTGIIREATQANAEIKQVTLNGRIFDLLPTGLQNAAYRLVSGRLALSGVRNQYDTDVILALDKQGRCYGKFSETTGRELVTLK